MIVKFGQRRREESGFEEGEVGRVVDTLPRLYGVFLSSFWMKSVATALTLRKRFKATKKIYRMEDFLQLY